MFRYNVEDLLQAYRKSRSGRDGMDTLANVDEICRGLFIFYDFFFQYIMLKNMVNSTVSVLNPF